MKALWHNDNRESTIEETEFSSSYPTKIKSLYSLISLGTESLVAKGLVPENMHKIMQVPYMEGTLGLPVKYGYSVIGSVVKSDEIAAGTIVHVMHPHQDVFSIETMHATRVPIGIAPKRAALVSNMETVINAVWDANLQTGQNVLIAGYGIIGAMLARICQEKYSCHVNILETDDTKNNYIQAHGYTKATSGDIVYDVAFNCTANENALQYCIDHVGEEGLIIELSWYGTQKVCLDLGSSFHSMRKKIISSQVSKIPKNKRSEYTSAKRKNLAFDLLNDDFFDSLLTDEIPFEESADFFNKLRIEKPSGIGYYLKY
jgi:threonine dehydrogenase-like Zn-dependent dehydrogenase